MHAHTPTPDNVHAIRSAIVAHGQALRSRYPLLAHQDALGLGILLFALLGIAATSLAWVNDLVPWWVCLLLNTVFVSLTQEVEHDLLHSLYFKKNRWVHNLMLALTWVARPSTVNPWVRRRMHMRHHQLSGTEQDVEERGLSNGYPWGILRLLMVADLMLASTVLVAQATTWKARGELLWLGFKAFFPVAMLTWGLWYVFLLFHGLNLLFAVSGTPQPWSPDTLGLMRLIDGLVVVLIAPNMLWSFCLHFISSNMHYYGDIEPRNVAQQTQVLNAWWLWPLHLFCFNFGATHGIHHFVVSEPFYIRQLTAGAAHAAMKANGVRFNDFASWRRANRWAQRKPGTPA